MSRHRCGAGVALVVAQVADRVTGRPSGRRGRSTQGRSSSRPTRSGRWPTACASSSFARPSSRSSACGCWCAPARRRIRPTSRVSRRWSRRCSIRGRRPGERPRLPTPSTTSAAGSAPGAGSDLSFVNAIVMQGRPRLRPRSAVGRRPQPGVRRRRARAPARAGAVRAQGELSGSRLRRERRRRAPHLRLPSRTAGRRTARRNRWRP